MRRLLVVGVLACAGGAPAQVTVTPTFFDTMPIVTPNEHGVRSFESLFNIAPQVVADHFGFGVSGAQSPENLYLVDGVSTNDPVYGLNAAQFPLEFIDHVDLLTGGLQADSLRTTGGVLSVVTKSGSNEFHGAVWSTFTPGALTGTSPLPKSDSSIFVQQSHLANAVDFGAEVGGPIIKDRLWFFVGFAPSFSTVQDTRSIRRFLINATHDDFVFDTDGYLKSEVLAGTTQQRFNDSRAFSYLAKLTWLATEGQLIELSVVGAPSSTSVPFSFVPLQHLGSWNGGSTSHQDSTTASLSYKGSFLEQRLLVDVSAGWFHVASGTLPNDGSSIGTQPGLSATGTPAVIYRREVPHSILDFESIPNPSLCEVPYRGDFPSTPTYVEVHGAARYLTSCPATGGGQTYVIGGMGFVSDNVLDRLQGRASVTYLMQALGSHRWKVGLDVERLSYNPRKAFSGGEILQESWSGTSFADYRQYGAFTGPDTAETQLVVHSIPSSTSIGAYLQDSWSILDLVTLTAGLRYETQQLFSGDGLLGLLLKNELSPRIGLIYDFTQRGRSKVFANYSRTYEAMPLDLADRSLTGESQYQFAREMSATSTRQGCNPLADIKQTFSECRDPNNYRQVAGESSISVKGVQTGSAKTPVDPTITPQSSDEIVVGGEYEIITDARVGATYTKRWLNTVVEDMSLNGGSTYLLGNPGYGLASSIPKATRDYDAVTASFAKAFSDGWQVQASYTWSYLRGNYDGLFRPQTNQLDPNVTSDFDLNSLLINRNGPLDANRTHSIKVFASKEFIFASGIGLSIGLSYLANSGAPLSYLGSNDRYGPNELFLLPRGTAGNLPWQHTVNAKVGVSYQLTPATRAQLSVDVFNVFNFAAVTAVDQSLAYTSVLPFVPDPANSTSVQEQTCLAGLANAACANGVTGFKGYRGFFGGPSPIPVSELNFNFKRPVAYQAPISARISARFSF